MRIKTNPGIKAICFQHKIFKEVYDWHLRIICLIKIYESVRRKYKYIVPPTLNTLNNIFINQKIILDLNEVWIFLKDFTNNNKLRPGVESWIYFKMFASWPKPYKVKIFYQKVLKCFLVECFLMCRCRHTSSRFLTQLIGTCFQKENCPY